MNQDNMIICRKCGKKFEKKIGKKSMEVKCPKCGSCDKEPAEVLSMEKLICPICGRESGMNRIGFHEVVCFLCWDWYTEMVAKYFPKWKEVKNVSK